MSRRSGTPRAIDLVVIPSEGDEHAPAARLDGFARACGWRPDGRSVRRGMRAERRADGVAVRVDATRIEAVGPVIEANAASHGLMIQVPELGAVVPSADLDGTPSRVWLAVGRAALEHELASDRGEGAMFEPFRYVAVLEIGERRVVHAALPRLHPTGAAPPDMEPIKYDDMDWHMPAVAGDPERAFVHIGMYLFWLIDHDLVERSWFDRQTIEAVRARAIRASGLIGHVDGTLVSEMLTARGVEFTDSYYGDPAVYLDDWAQTFGKAADEYRVPDTWDTYDAIAPVIERRHAAWRRAIDRSAGRR